MPAFDWWRMADVSFLSTEVQGLRLSNSTSVPCFLSWLHAAGFSIARFLRTEEGSPIAVRWHCKGGTAFFAAQLLLISALARLWQGATATTGFEMPTSCFN